MDKADRAEAVFGAFDGLVSIIGVVFALLVGGATSTIVPVAAGGAAAATVSMGSGDWLANGSPRRAVVMGFSTFVGSLLPALPFMFMQKTPAICTSVVLCTIAGAGIGWMRRDGLKGYLVTYAVLTTAVLLTLACVALFGGIG